MDRFTLSEGRAMVQDESVSPPFALILRRTQAEVRNLSTDNRSTAAFSAKGLADNAPVELAGTARFAPPSAWIDATLLASGLQLPAFSPYAMRSLGYKLDKGTLNLDIRHKVEARKLRSRGDGGPLAPADEPALLDLYARTFGGPAASAEEAAARLAVSLAPGPADLRALAMARGNAVAAYLQLKGVAPERFFSLEPAVDEKSETPAVTELQLDTK